MVVTLGPNSVMCQKCYAHAVDPETDKYLPQGVEMFLAQVYSVCAAQKAAGVLCTQSFPVPISICIYRKYLESELKPKFQKVKFFTDKSTKLLNVSLTWKPE